MQINLDFLKHKFVLFSVVAVVVIVALFAFTLSSRFFLSAILPSASPVSNSFIIVKFRDNPDIQNSSSISQLGGSPKVATKFNSINNLNEKYNTQSFKQMFAQVQGLPNTYELAVNTADANVTVKDFKNDSNVEYARISEPNFEKKIKDEVDKINQDIARQNLNWTAGYTVPGIMTDQDRMKLVGDANMLDNLSKKTPNNKVYGNPNVKTDYNAGGDCGGVVCPSGQVCNWNTGLCCTSNCIGKACGADDGCGNGCQASCPSGQVCNNWLGGGCCTTNCSGRVCGWDGCQGSCGDCPQGQVCGGPYSGVPVGTCCTQKCSGKSCGADGCGGNCGLCSAGNICNANGQCVAQRSTVPLAWDWRNANSKNYITPITNQMGCGSCWAFGAISAMEGEVNAYYNNPSINLNLSEQQIVSCANAGDCGGGLSDGALAYVMSTGVTNESCFPYTGTNNSCSNKCSTWQSNAWKVKNYVVDYYYDYVDGYGGYVGGYGGSDAINSIKAKVVQQGPLVTYFTVYYDFFSYIGGIYQPTSTSVAGGHAISIIGYGVDKNGKTYWIGKNSWGTYWGEAGFFKIYAGTSYFGTITMAITSPKPPTPQKALCEDRDKDKYCNWGLGPKPTIGCSLLCNKIEDCDDSNSKIGASCTCVPFLSCGKWSACIKGQQTRICVDNNNCKAKASEIQTRVCPLS